MYHDIVRYGACNTISASNAFGGQKADKQPTYMIEPYRTKILPILGVQYWEYIFSAASRQQIFSAAYI